MSVTGEGRGHRGASNWFLFLEHPLLPFSWGAAVLREPQLRAQQSLLDLKGICILKGAPGCGRGGLSQSIIHKALSLLGLLLTGLVLLMPSSVSDEKFLGRQSREGTVSSISLPVLPSPACRLTHPLSAPILLFLAISQTLRYKAGPLSIVMRGAVVRSICKEVFA